MPINESFFEIELVSWGTLAIDHVQAGGIDRQARKNRTELSLLKK